MRFVVRWFLQATLRGLREGYPPCCVLLFALRFGWGLPSITRGNPETGYCACRVHGGVSR